MSDWYVRAIENRANERAQIISIDGEKRDLFIQGAVFCAETLARILDVHPMEDDGGIAHLEKKRNKDFRNALMEILHYEKQEK